MATSPTALDSPPSGTTADFKMNGDGSLDSTGNSYRDDDGAGPDDSEHDRAQISRHASNASAGSVWVANTLSLPRETLLVIVVCMAQLLTQASYFGPLVLLIQIGRDFGVTSPPQQAWLIAGFSLTVGTFILFSGRLGDVFGYKRMLIIGFAWFSLWSLICGLSVWSNYTLAVFARVLQGIGPALCLPNALAVFGVAYPPGHRKAMVFAFFGAVAPNGAALGGVFGALLALVWWPWAFWVMAMWLAVVAVVAYFAIPDLPREKTAPWRSLKDVVDDLDLYGAVTGVVSLILFNFAWTQAPIDGWATPQVLVPLVLSLIIFGMFVFVESRVSTRPLLPFEAVNADVAFVLGAVVCGWATFGIWTLFTTRILQDIRQLSPLLTIAWFSPVTISGAIAAVITGKMLGPWNVKPAFVMTMALVAFMLGTVLTVTAPTDQTYWAQIFVSMIVMPFGMDMSFPAATLILSDAVGRRHQGIGASLVNTVVNYGIALGVGFAGTVEVNVNNGGETLDDHLKGFRGGLWMGVGVAGLGIMVCLAFVARDYVFKERGEKQSSKA